MMNLPPSYTSLVSLDTHSKRRFLFSLLLALCVHLWLFFLLWWLYTTIFTKPPKLHKIDTENLLVLKRGSSLDKTANTPGAPKPTLANNSQSHSTPPPQPRTPQKPKISPQSNSTKTNKGSIPTQENPQNNTQENPQTTSRNQHAHYDPRNLQFFTPLANQSHNTQSHSNAQRDKGLDKQTRRDINKLYGDEWGDLGSAERDFITSNLREIARITQSYLTYPNTAAYLNQSGENAVEFYLLPNGDIQGLKLLVGSGFVLLDKNSQKTIEIAYKDYPRPKQRTLIRFHITYFLY